MGRSRKPLWSVWATVGSNPTLSASRRSSRPTSKLLRHFDFAQGACPGFGARIAREHTEARRTALPEARLPFRRRGPGQLGQRVEGALQHAEALLPEGPLPDVDPCLPERAHRAVGASG